MNRDDALELARSLLRPAAALGYLVTRGPGWPPPEECGEYKRAVGHVMGNVYCLLQPVWEAHPELNPGSNNDPLGLENQPHPPLTGPAGLLPYLEEARMALDRVVVCMLEDPSIGRRKVFIEDLARQVGEAIAEAKELCA